MADLKILTIDGESRNIPQGGGGVTGVKGNSETDFRTGDVNLTPFNIAFLGLNPTGGLANDTVDFWKNLGAGYAVITQNDMVTGQPAQYGILLSFPNETSASKMIAQYFLVTASGMLYRRGNNAAATTNMPAFVAVDNDTIYSAGTNITITNGAIAVKASPAFTGTPTAPTNATASTSNTQIATTAFVQNAIRRRLPTTVVSDNIADFSCPTSSDTTRLAWTATGAGILIGNTSGQFAANAVGYRRIRTLINTSGTGSFQAVGASQSGSTALSCAFVARVASGDKVYSSFYQNSGSALQVNTAYFRGYFIPD